jgi:nucleoid-associated protein YgaU
LASRPRPVSARQVVVRPGDSLWRIAERLLPADASDAGVARLTWRLYTLNRATVGNDPDLILPGTTLLTPEGTP